MDNMPTGGGLGGVLAIGLEMLESKAPAIETVAERALSKKDFIQKLSESGSKATQIISKTGTKITGFVKHGVNRVIGDGHNRIGVKPQAILDAIKDPLKINQVKVDSLGRPSQRLIGRYAEVVINPDTGRIISVNPTSSSKASRLIKIFSEACK